MNIYDFSVRVSKRFTVGLVLLQYAIGTVICGVCFYNAFEFPWDLKTSNPYLIIFISTWFLLNTLFFPFAVYAYESIVRYLMTDNLIKIPKIISLFLKLIYLILCWAYAVVLAPIGLIIYFFERIINKNIDDSI